MSTQTASTAEELGRLANSSTPAATRSDAGAPGSPPTASRIASTSCWEASRKTWANRSDLEGK
jgi:hypothetical protein